MPGFDVGESAEEEIETEERIGVWVGGYGTARFRAVEDTTPAEI